MTVSKGSNILDRSCKEFVQTTCADYRSAEAKSFSVSKISQYGAYLEIMLIC